MAEDKQKKTYRVRPNLNQKKAFKIMTESIRNDKKINFGKILAQAGYSETMQKTPSRVFESNGFQQLLAQIDDQLILTRLANILMKGKDNDSLKSADMLLKLKDRYPQKKLKAMIYADEINNVMD